MERKKKNKPAKVLWARELRQRSTKAEQFLWQYLRDRRLFNKKFRRQHVFEGYVLDFYCPEDRLAIELDGPVHLKQKGYDEVRQDVIEDAGLEVLRF
ncbi:MAG: endonuclease domain-containing protein [Candidatus Margulisiibacteriota bacterium]